MKGNSGGTVDPVNGYLKFSLYPSADPNISPLWTEEHTNVSANKGMVNVLLGSIQSFDEPVRVTFDQERYLGITTMIQIPKSLR